MSESRGKDFPLPGLMLPLAVAFVTYCFARVFDRPSYESSRPKAEAFAFDPTAEGGMTDALLTQDPLEVAYGRAKEEPWVSSSSLLQLLPEPTTAAVRPSCLVLIALARGGAWPEDRQKRVRERYAVVSALIHSGFHAEQPRQIHFFCNHPPEPNVAPRTASAHDVVPYEVFAVDERGNCAGEERDAGAEEYRKVVVLWIDERSIREDPFGRVRALYEQLSLFERPVDSRILGPTSSGGLERWMSSVPPNAECKECAPPKPLELFSPYATAPEKRLRLQAPDENWLRITRTIGTDDELAQLLLLELRERIPSLMGFGAQHPAIPIEESRDSALDSTIGLRLASYPLRWLHFIPDPAPVHVALILEKDSFFGRAWRANLEDARTELCERDAAFGRLVFEEYSYMSVIDGQELPTAGTTAAVEAGTARGTSQVDFIRRIGARLEEQGGVQAIGVLGSDSYDVLLILDALRSRFPDAIFFTTDLDAQYLDEAHRSSTLNLVVASPGGLVEDEPQDRGPEWTVGAVPFRDTYQLSVHRTVQQLVTGIEACVRPPRLYEIGAGAPVELNTDGMLPPIPDTGPRRLPRVYEKLVCLARSLPFSKLAYAAEASVEVSGSISRGKSRWVLASLGALFALVLIVGHRPGTFSEQKPMARLQRVAVVSALALLGGLALLLLVIDIDGASRLAAAEPVELTLGVSVWPTVVLRLAAIVVCGWGILCVRDRWLRTRARLVEAFSLLPAMGSPGGPMPWRWLLSIPAKEAEERQDLAHVLDALGTCAAKWLWFGLRLSFYVLVGLAAFAPLFILAPLSTPVRGEFAYLWERVSIAALVFAFLALFFYVLEISFIGQRLVVRILDPSATLVPAAALQREAERTGLSGRLLEIRLRLRVVQAITYFTDRIVLWPAAVAALMIVSRASVFDRWSWPMPLVFTQAFFFVLLALCVWNNRRAAGQHRFGAHKAVGEELLRCAGDPVRESRLRTLAKELAEMRGGAFSPVLQQPLFHSLVLPFLALLVSYVAEHYGLN